MRMVCGLNGDADRIAHPGVGDRESTAPRNSSRARRSQVTMRCCTLRQAVPAEEEQADEGGLEEEGHQPFDGERHAENVADIMGVIGPVGSELELHGDAGGDAHREINAEQRAPEFHRVAPDRAAGHHIDALHDGDQQREAERERHEKEVVERGQRELQARQSDDVEMLEH